MRVKFLPVISEGRARLGHSVVDNDHDGDNDEFWAIVLGRRPRLGRSVMSVDTEDVKSGFK